MSSSSSEAQVNPRFASLWLEDGLPDKTVRAVTQDAQGFIWFGTSYGLTRFDGNRMVTFVADASRPGALPHDRVYALHTDARGDLWAGTRDGLGRYRPGDRSFEVFRHDPERTESLSSPRVLALEDGDDGSLWVGTHKGLDRLDPVTGRVERLAEGFPALGAGRVRALHRTADGRLWIGSRGGLLLWDPATGSIESVPLSTKPLSTKDGLAKEQPGDGKEPSINAVVSGDDGTVWVGTHGHGLLRWDPTRATATRVEAVDDEIIFSLWMDGDGTLWVGTESRGLFRRSTEGSWNAYRYDPGDADSLQDNAVLAIYVDRSATLWAGSFQAGVHRLPLRTLDFGRHDNGRNSLSCLPSAITNDLHPVAPSTLVVATELGLGVVDQDTGECEVYTQAGPDAASLSSSAVFSVHVQADGTVWAGTLRGLDRLDLDRRTVRQVPEVRDVPVYALAESEAGVLWVGTTDGLYRSRGERFERVDLPGSVTPPLQVNGMAFAGPRLWLAGQRGLLSWSPETGRLEPPPAEPPELASWIGAVHVDRDGTVWVGVDEVGLFALTAFGDPWEPLRLGQELPDFKRFGTILDDDKGHLWVATPRGLFRIDPAERDVIAFRASDGLQSDDFVGNSFFRSSTGRFFLGGRRGFNVFQPEGIVLDETVPQVALTRFLHMNEAVVPGKEHRGLTLAAPVEQLDEVVLTHRDHVFGFEFAALHFADPSRNRYAYKLHGFDAEWIRTEARGPRATYTNLDPGSYVFQVRAAHAHGPWNDQGAHLRIEILPAPWATWWAYTLYVLLVATAIVLFFLYRTEALRRRARELEVGVRERTQIIESLLEQKNEEMATLSHELRTPLTLILGPVKSVMQSIETPSLQKKLSVVRRNGFRLLRMVDQLLHMERFRVQSVLPRRATAVKPTLEAIGESFRELALEQDVQVSVGPVEDLWLDLVPDTLEKILLNLLSNALKYTPAGGQVWVSAVAEGEQAVITVRDTGLGIDVEHREKIFERYQRLLDSDSERVTGAGIGLALVQELVQAHGGEVELESELGKGSTFTLYLPKAALPAESGAVSLDPELLELELESLAEQREPWQEDRPGSDLSMDDGRPSVLIIEDNRDMSRYIAETLSPRFACRAAADGASGLDLAWQEIPDLIISDIMMPKMDGYEVLGQLKDDARSSHIPVILLTARGDRKSRHRGWQERADEYLTKPFDEQELLLRVGNLLEIRAILRRRFAQELGPGVPRTKEAGKDLNPRDREFVDTFRGLIEEHYEDPDLRLAQMTRHMALSERPLQRKLKALLGQTPIEYLRAYRLTKAGERLREGLMVAEVAESTGFSSQSYFATCFKAHFGVTPSQYRDRAE